MRVLTSGLFFLALIVPLLGGCQRKPAGTPPEAVQQQPSDPTRELWKKEKAEVFAAVGSCQLSPEDAMQRLTRRRDELAPAVKDDRPFGFDPVKVRQIAEKAGCSGG